VPQNYSDYLKTLHGVVNKRNKFRSFAGNTWTFSKCSVDRALDIGVLVTGALTSNAFFGEGGRVMYTTTQTRKEPRNEANLFIVIYINFYHVIFNWSLVSI